MRRPMIPVEELHASSVQHPANEDWRWILQVRRVPVAPSAAATEPAGQVASGPDTRPRCAGVGNPEALVWSCWDCLSDLGAKTPTMPVCGLTTENWNGRERPHVRAASAGTKMLGSLARCCMKQVRLGRNSDPMLKDRALTGNTILLELPPPKDALVDAPHHLSAQRECAVR